MRHSKTDLGPDEALWFAEEVGEREKEEEGEVAEGEDQVPDALSPKPNPVSWFKQIGEVFHQD